jgi:hypothetical protein
MSRAIILSLLLLTLLCSAPSQRGVVAGAVPAAEAAETCQQMCLAEQRDCLASGACTTGTPGEQKECKRVCERTYTLCVEACG